MHNPTKKDFSLKRLGSTATFVYFLLICGFFPTAYLHQTEEIDTTNPAENQEEFVARLQLFICNFEGHFENDDDVDIATKKIDGPYSPILEFMQILLKNETLFNAFLKVPETKNFPLFLLALYGHPGVEPELTNSIKAYARRNRNKRPTLDDGEFMTLKNNLCNNTAPQIIHHHDRNIEAQLSAEQNIAPYCRRLFIDAIRSSYGKVSWTELKPFVKGKIVYGPFNDDTKQIIAFSNKPFEDITRLRQIFATLNQTDELFKTDHKFRSIYNVFLRNTNSISNFEAIETIMKTLYNKTQTKESLTSIDSALACFSGDRFVPVNNENELDVKVLELMKTNDLLAAVYFKNIGKQPVYRMTMRVDNRAVMIDNNDGTWFPHLYGGVQLERHHIRGFSKIQELIGDGLTKHRKTKYENIKQKSLGNQNIVQTTTSKTSQNNLDDIIKSFGVSPSEANKFLKSNNISASDILNFLGK